MFEEKNYASCDNDVIRRNNVMILIVNDNRQSAKRKFSSKRQCNSMREFSNFFTDEQCPSKEKQD